MPQMNISTSASGFQSPGTQKGIGSIKKEGERSMNYDPELAALLSQPWSNDACRGYVIAAMERCGFKPSDIEQVMVELYEVFDYTTLQEAEAYYERSPY